MLVSPPSFEESGMKRKTCRDCGAQDYKLLPKIKPNHTHVYNTYESGQGGHWLECVCGARKDDNIYAHVFGNWTITVDPTETTTGERYRKCRICDYVEYGSIDKLPHTHKFDKLRDKNQNRYALPNGYVDDDCHAVYCTGCDAYQETPHHYKPWRISSSDPNIARRFCYDCGYTQTKYRSGKYQIAVDYSDFKVVSHIKFPKASYALEVEGAKFEIWSDYLQMYSKVSKNNGTIKAGSEIHLIKEIPENSVFDHWEVTDASGLVSEWFDCGWTDDYIIMPPNSVKLRAVYRERIKDRLDITGFTLPAAGAISPQTAFIPEDYAYTVDHINWHEKFGPLLQKNQRFEAGEEYYAEIYVKPNEGYFFESNIRISTVTLNGSDALVRGGYASGGYYVVVTENMTVGEIETLGSVNLSIPFPADGDKSSGEKTVMADGYYGRVTGSYFWSDSADNETTPYNGNFRFGETYYLNLVINTTGDCQFDVDDNDVVNTNVTVNGAAVQALPWSYDALFVKIPYEVPRVSGDCSWSFDEANGILTISGEGAMTDYAPADNGEINTPWYSIRDKINSVVIENGVTHIGTSAFEGTNAVTADIPATVSSIGVFAFGYKYENGRHVGVEGFVIYGAPGGAAQGYADTCPQFCTFQTGSSGYSGDVKWSVNLAAKTITFEGPGAMGDDQDWRAFRSDITKAVFKNGITRIGNDALMLFENLDTVEFENCPVESIGEYAFNKCTALKTINLRNKRFLSQDLRLLRLLGIDS